MKPRSLLLSLGLLFTAPFALQAQVPPDKAVGTFTVSDGLEISLWASEPLFANPTCMDIDHKGRVWICESVNYRHTLHHQPPRRPAGDRILILEDSKGTGKADKVTVFYQSPQILAPLGIAVAKDPVGPGYKVYVCQSPDILLFEDKDGDGKADGPPKKLLSGFGGVDHDHGVHGILIGPDGKLYFSIGDQGVKGLVDKNGKRWTSNQIDCRAGTIWRCDLDGKNLELLAHNFRNEYEPCVDSFGTIFVSDNDDDGNQQTRICYVMPGGNYGYWPRGPGESHWHEEQPGVVPKILRTYFGSPTGICVYEGKLLPQKYWGQLLHTDAGPRHVRCYHLTPEGASYAVEREEMVTSSDNWFRPSDICVAPDGSVYVADWYDPGVGGHGMGDTTRGRIFRIAPKGNKPSVPPVDLGSQKGLIAALGSPALSVRSMAIAKLQSMEGVKAWNILKPALNQKEDATLRARALWQASTRDGRWAFEARVPKLMQDPDPRIRVLTLRILKDVCNRHPADPHVREAVLKDPSPAVRREALLLCRDVDPAKVKSLILELAKKYDGKDRFYLEAVGIAVGQDKARRDVVLADFDKQFPGWNEQVAGLVWELRPPQILPRLEKQLTDAKLPAEQRGRIVDILAASEDSGAGKTLLKLLQSLVPPDVRAHVVANLKQFLPAKWRDLRSSPELARAINYLLEKPELRTDGLTLIAAAEKKDAIPRVRALAADEHQPLSLRRSAVETLGQIPSPESVAALETLFKGALATEAVQALGQQIPMWSEGPGTKQALARLQALALDKSGYPAVRQAAVLTLAGSRPGTIWLLSASSRRQLPEELKADVGRLLRNSPYQDLRNKAMVAFPAPGRIDLKKLPGIAQLALRRGDPSHGKQLMVASLKSDLQCLKCHTIRGVGGSVGPDLSVIGKKASRENLFESIVFPSKAIADQYVSWVVATNKGLVVTGLLVEERPDYVTLRDANGKDFRINKGEIDSRAKSPVSLMPADLASYLTEDDLVDLVEYLFGLKTPALSPDLWHIAGPFDNGAHDAGLDQVFPPERGIDLKATYAGKSGPVHWRVVRPNGQGYVDLQAFLAGDSVNVLSYLYREVESPVDQEALVLLGTDDGAKLWVNETLVYTNREHRAAVPEQDTVKVRLRMGRNRLLLKLNNGDGAHGFYLTILAEQELKQVAGSKDR
jgi:putative membrane-bound dehydrogenase-like protein